VALPGAARAAPGNDNLGNATAISALPFSDSVDISQATTEPNEPQICGNFLPMTVWYSITPATDGILHVTGPGSTFNGIANVYRADGPAITDLTGLACNNLVYMIDVPVEAGQTYYIQAGSYGDPGTLNLQVSESVQPANDDFDNAEPIASLPLSMMLDTSLATTAFDDPFDPCLGGQGTASVWFTLSEVANTPVAFDTAGSDAADAIAIYTGTRGALTLIGCGHQREDLGFNAAAGVTYHIELVGDAGRLQLHVRQGPTVTGFAVSKNASVNNASGVATISGTMSCDQNTTATVSGTLRQKLNRFKVITGSYSFTTACSPTGSAWSTKVIGDNGPYGGGQAGADATGTACLTDPFGFGANIICTSQNASQTVSLHGGH
jgi:hypothetical protein